MANRLFELHFKKCFTQQITGASRVPYMARSCFPTYRWEADMRSSGGNSTYSAFLASPYRKAVLTSARMIDLLAPSSRFVIAQEITVRIATHQICLQCGTHVPPDVPSQFSCSSVPLIVITHLLDAQHLPLFIPFHGFPYDNRIHFHPLESFHLFAFLLQSQSSDSCVSGYHEDSHSSGIPSALEISLSSAASIP